MDSKVISHCDRLLLAQYYYVLENGWTILSGIRTATVVPARQTDFQDDLFIFGNVKSAVLDLRRTLKLKVFSVQLGLTQDQLVEKIAKFLLYVDSETLPTKQVILDRVKNSIC